MLPLVWHFLMNEVIEMLISGKPILWNWNNLSVVMIEEVVKILNKNTTY